MAKQKGRPPDDPSSAPESGTPRDTTSGNNPSDRANDPRAAPATAKGKQKRGGKQGDDPSVAGEER